MRSHNMQIHWMYQYYVLYLAWWQLNEPKHVAEFLTLITNICCVIDWNKLLYKNSSDGVKCIYYFSAETSQQFQSSKKYYILCPFS